MLLQNRSCFSMVHPLKITRCCAPVAQLDRAPDYGSGGLGFESLRARQFARVSEVSDFSILLLNGIHTPAANPYVSSLWLFQDISISEQLANISQPNQTLERKILRHDTGSCNFQLSTCHAKCVAHIRSGAVDNKKDAECGAAIHRAKAKKT